MRAVRLFAVLALSTLAACQSCGPGKGGGAAKEDLQLLPKETDIVFKVNVERMRKAPMWKKVIEVRDASPAKAQVEEFTKKCGLDPFTQIDSLFAGFPASAGENKEFGLIVRGHFDEQKLVACARDEAKKKDQEVVVTDYEGKKLYSTSKDQDAQVVFLDPKTVAVGGKTWTKKIVDLAAGKKEAAGQSAKDRTELTALLTKTKTGEAVYGAGVVPQSARDLLKADPNLASAASMKAMYGSMDFQTGFTADFNVDLGSEADAKDVVGKVSDQLAELKKNPQMNLIGMVQFLDAVKVETKQATFHTTVSFTQPQVDDLTNRVKGLLGSFGGSLGAPSLPLPSAPPAPSEPETVTPVPAPPSAPPPATK